MSSGGTVVAEGGDRARRQCDASNSIDLNTCIEKCIKDGKPGLTLDPGSSP